MGAQRGDETVGATWMLSQMLITSVRAALFILVHDAEIAALCHQEPFLRHRGKCIPMACRSATFLATSVNEWARLVQRQISTNPKTVRCTGVGAARPPSFSDQLSTKSCCKGNFTAYATLQGIGASICEDRIGNQQDHMSRAEALSDLMKWYKIHGESVEDECDPLLLMVLWHWTCMSNFVDLHRLELSVGKKGPERASLHSSYVSAWANSVDAKRCVMHAFLLQLKLEELHSRRVVTLHVPRALFSAAIVWSAYLNSLSGSTPSITPEDTLGFAEFRLLGIDFTHQWVNGIGFGKRSLSAIKASTLCTLTDILQRIGYWEISRKFSSILSLLIHGGTDDNMIIS